jgi:hypothetical protein
VHKAQITVSVQPKVISQGITQVDQLEVNQELQLIKVG